MYKQILSLIVIVGLSAVIVMFQPQVKSALEFLVSMHTYVATMLTEVFSASNGGNIARGLVALLAIPVLVGFIPSLLYFLVRKSWCPYFMEIVWVLWLLEAGALIMSTTVAVAS